MDECMQERVNANNSCDRKPSSRSPDLCLLVTVCQAQQGSACGSSAHAADKNLVCVWGGGELRRSNAFHMNPRPFWTDLGWRRQVKERNYVRETADGRCGESGARVREWGGSLGPRDSESRSGKYLLSWKQKPKQ